MSFMNPVSEMRRTLAVLAAGLALVLAGAHPLAAEPANPEMADSISPYLRLHAEDPVQWRAWDRDLLDEARESGRPLLISSGYFSCHYCHVMHEESFLDQGIAERLNEQFIPVKLDREVHTALDTYLLEFQRATGGSAGWPLNVVVMPEGHALTGVVYAPRDGFADFLDGVVERLTADEERLAELAAAGSRELEQRLRDGEQPLSAERAARLPDVLWSRMEREADDLGGGFGQETRFPHSPYLDALLTAQEDTRAPDWVGEFLSITLEEMAGSGLRDVLGGGFFRYSETPDWGTPHFEIMLEDQAQLARVYLRAGELFGREDWTRIGLETLDFVGREMALRDSDPGAAGAPESDFRGFASSLSALDDEGREGGAYLWPGSALEAALEDHPEQDLVRARFGMDRAPSFSAGHLPADRMDTAALAERFELDEERVRDYVDRGREALIETRQERGLPRDEKVLTGAHGLLLSALAEAVRQDLGEEYAAMGRDVRDWLASRADEPEDLPALLGLPAEEAGPATLPDYAYVARGLHDWDAATDSGDGERVRALLRTAWERFAGDDGFRTTEDPPLPGMIAERFHPAVHRPSGTTAVLQLTAEHAAADADLESALADYPLEPGQGIESNPLHHAGLILWLEERGDNVRR
ncbi:thioredoxin domain-containing protein [Thioalkalivibrio sp. ALR17-21]|uniref:thioredoxin domain-containing protein n=1 Tax=Thioalkalivibrio sp. ALR17-21 TaxID=1269813 RepID=UPI0003F796ED|nr:DUF255 domain-containing protein [Thioalkalivibrio sp. ALR17-21]